MKLCLCQMPVTASKTENDTVMRRYVRDAAAAGCDLVALPEMWCCPYNNAAFVQYAEPQGGEIKESAAAGLRKPLPVYTAAVGAVRGQQCDQ